MGQYDASVRIEASDYLKATHADVKEGSDGPFQVCGVRDGSSLTYQKIRNLGKRRRRSVTGVSTHGLHIEVRRGAPDGSHLATITIKPQAVMVATTHTALLGGVHDTDDLCLVFRGVGEELIRLDCLEFS